MSDDLTVMGIAATAAAAMGREQIVLAHQAEHPLAGQPGSQTAAQLLQIATSSAWSEIAGFGPRRHCRKHMVTTQCLSK